MFRVQLHIRNVKLTHGLLLDVVQLKGKLLILDIKLRLLPNIYRLLHQ
jgi:hypothetical protein